MYFLIHSIKGVKFRPYGVKSIAKGVKHRCRGVKWYQKGVKGNAKWVKGILAWVNFTVCKKHFILFVLYTWDSFRHNNSVTN